MSPHLLQPGSLGHWAPASALGHVEASAFYLRRRRPHGTGKDFQLSRLLPAREGVGRHSPNPDLDCAPTCEVQKHDFSSTYLQERRQRHPLQGWRAQWRRALLPAAATAPGVPKPGRSLHLSKCIRLSGVCTTSPSHAGDSEPRGVTGDSLAMQAHALQQPATERVDGITPRSMSLTNSANQAAKPTDLKGGGPPPTVGPGPLTGPHLSPGLHTGPSSEPAPIMPLSGPAGWHLGPSVLTHQLTL